MKIILWSIVALFLIGNALFVLPIHISSDSITSNYTVNYKRDSLLLHNIFSDSTIQLKLNLPPLYQGIYDNTDSFKSKINSSSYILVNTAVLHNLDFTAVAFPFYKVTTFNSIIPFFSIIKASNAPDMDSTVLVGNIIINGKLSVKGISSPVYAKGLLEKELVRILGKELRTIETTINRKPPVDTTQTLAEPEIDNPKKPTKRK